MREIKFRAWSQAARQMFLFDLGKRVELEDRPVMQFTGLRDRNDREIYESDIVAVERPEEHSFTGVIEFVEGSFYVHTEAGLSPNYPKLQYINIHPGQTRVIGTTYENPELLEIAL